MVHYAAVLLWCLLVGMTGALSPTHAQEVGSEAIEEAGSSVRMALQQQVAEAAPTTGDAQDLTVFFHKRGVANLRLGRYTQATTDLREASRNPPMRPTSGDWGTRWRMLSDLHGALLASGDLLGALELMTLRMQEFPQNLATLATAKANLELSLGLVSNAQRTYVQARRAMDEYRAGRSPTPILATGWQVTLEELAARMQEAQGNRAEGERYRRLALQLGQEATAIASKFPPQNVWRARLAPDGRRSTMRGLAVNLSGQGRFGEAEYLTRQLLVETLQYHAPQTTLASIALRTLAEIRLQQGRLADAEHWRRLGLAALMGAEILPHSRDLGLARSELASALVLQGRWHEALSVLEEREKGLRSSQLQPGLYTLDWAMALHRTGNTEASVAQLRGMIRVTLDRPYRDPANLAQLRGYLGIALAAQGKSGEALQQFGQSIPVLLARAEEDAGNDSAGFVGLYRLQTIIEGYLELLAKCHAGGCTLAGIDPVAEAFRMADVARGSAVQRAVTSSAARASLPDPQLLALARQEQTTGNRLQSLRKVMERLASASADQRLNKIVADMQRDIAQLEAEQKAQRRELAQRFPDYANLVDPQPAALADVQRALTADEAVVAIYVAEQQTYVWTMTRDKVAFRVLAKGRAQIAADVAQLRAGMDLTDTEPKPFDSAKAYQLYQQLLAPDAPLWSGARVLNVIPHGALGQLPFAMLLSEPAQKLALAQQAWLVRKVAIAQLPSANALLALRKTVVGQAPTLPLIGFGDPVFGAAQAAQPATRKLAVRSLSIAAQKDEMLALLEQAQRDGKPIAAGAKLPAAGLAQAFALLAALPETADELREIAQALGADAARDIYTGSRATEKNVKAQDLTKYRVVAFATHGLVPGEIPGLDQPALALSNPNLTQDRDNDGFLTMEEVLALQMNADWVVLSACNTASSDGQASEAVSGLGRAFFYAGARSLLVSNWPVETMSARLLTTGLFRSQANNAQLGRAQALRQSMLEVMAQADYAHPVFWAPFSLVGDGGR